MGFIAFPFIACFILALFGWPFMILWYLYDKGQRQTRRAESNKRDKALAFYRMRNIEAINRGKPLTEKEKSQIQEDAYRIYGVRI